MNNFSKSSVLTNTQVAHAANLAKSISHENGNRDAALVLTCFSSGLTITEIARLTIKDYLAANGEVLHESEVREKISYNGRSRPLFWANAKTNSAIDAHLAERSIRNHGTTSHKTFRGLEPDSALFVSGRTGAALKISVKVRDGQTYYSCNQLSRLITRLFELSGAQGVTAQSGRRTLACKMAKHGIKYSYIGEVLGIESLEAVKRLCQGSPPCFKTIMKSIYK
ncbi:tyrosine-type recombinase/integrase [Pseudomonas sp. PSKL.D1]|uniref:tyrosine-type recombinase/integrase n=1 Tax=Pseudomonas sp. PSKL.D1 TaxID=3029060 RepID=UPI00238181E3|nr:tyrosine-type recombinase/integrase [Pseudomonas sp. PSKL.D1]WDY59061.1 tyrosine-type recombinase/integrase [Pseudomonas sp. PSKL.D1]